MTERGVSPEPQAPPRGGVLSRIADWWRGRPVGPGPSYGSREALAAFGPMVPPNAVGRPAWLPRDPATYSREGYEKLALVFRCVLYTANAIASASLRVYDERQDGDEVPDHALRRLMRRPNPTMGETRWLAFVGTVMATAGFCVVEKERTSGGLVTALWPLRPDWLRPVPRPQAAPDWEYRIPGLRRVVRLKAEDVMVFPYADLPDGSPYGIGPLATVLREVALTHRLTDFLKAFFDGGAMPLYGLVPDLQPGMTMTKTDADELRRSWVRRFGGQELAEPAVLAGIKDVKRLSFDFDELALTDLRDLSDMAVCQAFGIHPSMVGARVGLEHSDSRANAAEARRGFYEDTITPLWARIDDILTLGLLPEFEPAASPLYLEFDKSDIPALQEDRNEKARWAVPAVTGGAMSVHAFHRELGLPLPAGVDYYLRPVALFPVPVTNPLELPAPASGGEGQSSLVVREVLSGNGNGHTVAAIGPGDLQSMVDDHEVRELMARTGAPELRARSAVEARRLVARVTARSEPLVRRALEEQADRLVRALRAAPGTALRADSPDEVLAYLRLTAEGDELDRVGPEALAISDVDWGTERRRFGVTVARVHDLAARAAVGLATSVTGVVMAFDLANPYLRSAMEEVGQSIVGIVEETRRRVAQVVTDGLAAGQTVDEVAARLTEVVGSPGRAATIARTESMNAFGAASEAGYRMSGVVDRAQCFDNPGHTEPYGASDGLTCAERDGLVVALSDASRHRRAEHPNGSFAMAPVLRGEPDPSRVATGT